MCQVLLECAIARLTTTKEVRALLAVAQQRPYYAPYARSDMERMGYTYNELVQADTDVSHVPQGQCTDSP